MPVAELAQYGIGFVAIGGLFFLVGKLIDKWFEQKKDDFQPQIVAQLATVVQNNTQAVEKLTILVQDIRVDVAAQGQKLDELVAKARRE